MSDVITQGATRWARPSDYGDSPAQTPADRHQPRTPSSPAPGRPGRNPDWKPAPLKPDTGFPDHAKPFPKPKRVPPPKLPMPGSPIPAGRAIGIPGAIRAGGIVGGIFAAIDIIDHYWRYYPAPLPNPDNGWTQTWKCPNPPTAPDVGIRFNRQSNDCIKNQSVGADYPQSGEFRNPVNWTTYGHWWKQSATRYSHRQSWSRTTAARDRPQVEPQLITGAPAPFPPAPNPTPFRSIPSVKPNPMPEPMPEADPRLDRDGPGGSPVRIGRQFRPGLPGVPTTPGPRQPPKKNEKDKKAMSRSKQLGVALFRALDFISESAELVDAMYDALPKKVRDKWKCHGVKPGRHPGLDAAGQYGLDQADCKAKALWHNFHSMDIQTAVENIIKNHLSDKLVGAMHRVLPNNIGNSMEEGEIALNNLISDFMDDLIDFDGWKQNEKGYF